eukprot:Em0006g140a
MIEVLVEAFRVSHSVPLGRMEAVQGLRKARFERETWTYFALLYLHNGRGSYMDFEPLGVLCLVTSARSKASPGAPSNVQPSLVCTNSLTLQWTMSASNNAAGYVVLLTTISGTTVALNTTTSAMTTIGDLIDGTSYTVSVAAINCAGSSNSNSVSVQTFSVSVTTVLYQNSSVYDVELFWTHRQQSCSVPQYTVMVTSATSTDTYNNCTSSSCLYIVGMSGADVSSYTVSVACRNTRNQIGQPYVAMQSVPTPVLQVGQSNVSGNTATIYCGFPYGSYYCMVCCSPSVPVGLDGSGYLSSTNGIRVSVSLQGLTSGQMYYCKAAATNTNSNNCAGLVVGALCGASIGTSTAVGISVAMTFILSFSLGALCGASIGTSTAAGISVAMTFILSFSLGGLVTAIIICGCYNPRRFSSKTSLPVPTATAATYETGALIRKRAPQLSLIRVILTGRHLKGRIKCHISILRVVPPIDTSTAVGVSAAVTFILSFSLGGLVTAIIICGCYNPRSVQLDQQLYTPQSKGPAAVHPQSKGPAAVHSTRQGTSSCTLHKARDQQLYTPQSKDQQLYTHKARDHAASCTLHKARDRSVPTKQGTSSCTHHQSKGPAAVHSTKQGTSSCTLHKARDQQLYTPQSKGPAAVTLHKARDSSVHSTKQGTSSLHSQSKGPASCTSTKQGPSSCTLHKARDQQLYTPQSKGPAAVHSTKQGTSSCTLHKARDQQLYTPQSKGSAAVHSTKQGTSSCTLHKARDQQLYTPQSKGPAAVHATKQGISSCTLHKFVDCTAADP